MGSVMEFLLKIVAAAVLAPQLGYFGICICEPVIWTVCAAIVLADYIRFVRKTSPVTAGRKKPVMI